MNSSVLVSQDSKTLVVILGLGLVGTSVSRYLSSIFDDVSKLFGESCRIDWNDHNSALCLLNESLDYFKPDMLELIWAAGKAGFSATSGEMEDEYKYLSASLRGLVDMQQCETAVSMFSSAGGIYENSGYVNNIDDVGSVRPYGKWKLRQEGLVREMFGSHRIYRVTSVYGVSGHGKRAGLVNALVLSARTSKEIQIYAKSSTVRDYVHVNQIGHQCLSDLQKRCSNFTRILGAGRAISISDLIRLVARVTGKSPKASFTFNSENDLNISFHPVLFEGGVESLHLEQGISLVNAEAYRLT